MAAKRKPSPGAGKLYVRFAWGTIAAAALFALAALDGGGTDAPAPDPVPPTSELVVKPGLVVKKSRSSFAMDPAGPAADASAQAGAEPGVVEKPAVRPIEVSPPPGDPAEQIGVKHYQAPVPGYHTPEQAGQLITDSRARSGGADQGDEALKPD